VRQCFQNLPVVIRYIATDQADNFVVQDVFVSVIDDIQPVISGIADLELNAATIDEFSFPVPVVTDNDGETYSASLRAILGSADALNPSELDLIASGSITPLSGIHKLNGVFTRFDLSASTSLFSPTNERYPNAFDGNTGTKYLNFKKEFSGIEFSINGSPLLRAIEFVSANDSPERDPITFYLEGSDDGQNWVFISSGNTNIPQPRNTIGLSAGINAERAYARYRIYFPELRNTASANSMQIAEIRLFKAPETSASLEEVRAALRERRPVLLQYTVTDAAGNISISSITLTYTNFAPIVNDDVSIEEIEITANQTFSFTYPNDVFIDLDLNEVLTYSISNLPPGLTFNPNTLTIEGTPSLIEGASIEDYHITLTVTDSENAQISRSHTIRVFYTATINFIANGGSAVGTQTNIISQPLPTPPSPGRTGYTFEGWYENETLTLPFDWDGVMGDTDITLYAKWEIINYPIQYVFNISNTPLKGSYTIEEETHLFQPASSAGRTFMGWFYDAAFTQEATQINAGSTGPVTVYARWEANEYTLSYRANGRTVSSVTVRFGEPVPGGAPAIPPREGFIAVGWSSEAPEFMPARSIRIEAIYEELPVEEVDDPIDEEVIDEPLDEEELDDEPLDDELDDEDEVDDETEEEPGDEEVEVPLDTVTPDEPTPTPLPSAPNPILPPANVIIPSRTPQRVEIPVVVLPENPDPVVTRVSVNGIDLDISIIPGQPVGNLPPATLAGYNFQGWMNAITGEMMTPETVINNPDFVVLVPLFEKAPTLLDATRNVFQQLIVNPLLQITKTNDFHRHEPITFKHLRSLAMPSSRPSPSRVAW
jgi:uncharacterized repeat protein (TIGR02543 family)